MGMERIKWRFLDTGKENAFFNMALDEAIVCAVGRGISPPAFRLYEWSPDAVTFGYSQNVADIINIEHCKSDGVDITRRLTGGHAVFHKNESAYSVVGVIDDPHFGGSIMDTYRSINKVLAEGFNVLGIDAKISHGRLGKCITGTNLKIAPCFVTASKFEITLDGKKLVGSAQRRFKRLFLQQGSILIGLGSEKITEYMIDNNLAAEYRKLLAERSIDLKSKLNGNFNINSLKISLFDSFKKTAGLNCKYEVPAQEELKLTERLIEERYSSKGWVIGYE